MLLTVQDSSSVHPETETRALWQRWCKLRESEARNALFLYYSPWLQKITTVLYKQYHYPLAEWADYAHAAAIGLLHALDHYDISRNVPFEAYALARLKGAVLNELAHYLTGQAECKANYAKLPDESHDSSSSNYSSDPLNTIIDVAVELTLGHFLELGFTQIQAEQADPLYLYQNNQELNILLGLVSQLAPKERLLIRGHYLHQLKFRELAHMLGVSAPRVSQLHQQALRNLRKLYENVY